MSYARFGEDSDVYVFATRYNIECCGCWLQERKWINDPDALFKGYLKSVGEVIQTVFNSNEEMLVHLEKHIAKGHAVPEYCLERLRDPEDAQENISLWAKYEQENNESAT
jgi:hypothetical protein